MNLPAEKRTTLGDTQDLAATIPLAQPGSVAGSTDNVPTQLQTTPMDMTVNVAHFGGQTEPLTTGAPGAVNAPDATVPMSHFSGSAQTIITGSAPQQNTQSVSQAGTDPAAPTQILSGADYQPNTGAFQNSSVTQTAGGLSHTGLKRKTRINGNLPTDTQALDLKLQMSRVSVFSDMASHSAGKLTSKLSRLVEAHGTHGRYIVNKPLASGGMGAVLEIKDGDFQRRAAMKIILPRFAKSPETLERFLAEAQVTAQLEHPNIVPIHDLGIMDDGTLYFTMKFIEGQSLGSVIKKLQEGDAAAVHLWTIETILLTFLKVLDGVGFAHSRGVVHRDIKPDNLMLGAHGEVLVVDWGIAKVLADADKDSELVQKIVNVRSQENLSETMVGSAIGTLYYMPPEQVEGRLNDIDRRSDIYALGATLYELVTLKRSLEKCEASQMMACIAHGQIIPVLVSKPDLPVDLAAIIMRAMALSREDRYQDCAAFAEDLRNFLSGQAVAARRRNIIERLGAWIQKNRTQVIAGTIATVLVLTAVAGTVAYQKQQNHAAMTRSRDAAQAAFTAGNLDEARDHITNALSHDHGDPDSIALKAQIFGLIAEHEKQRDAIAARKRAADIRTKAQLRFASATDSEIAAILGDLNAADAMSPFVGIDTLRLDVQRRQDDITMRLQHQEADNFKRTGDGLLAQATRMKSDDEQLDATIEQIVTAFAQAEKSAKDYAPVGLADARARLDDLRRTIATARRDRDDHNVAELYTSKARAALDAKKLDEATAAIEVARNRLPTDRTVDVLRQEIISAKKAALLDAETKAQRLAAREGAVAALKKATDAQALMERASHDAHALIPHIEELELSGKNRDDLITKRRALIEAQQKVAEQWALVEQSASAATTALDTERDFITSDGIKPWVKARSLLAALYWGRLKAAKEAQSLPEIAAFTNFLNRYDDGKYHSLLTGNGTLTIQGSGNLTLRPVSLDPDGRLIPQINATTETLTLPIGPISHASGRWEISTGSLVATVFLPPNGTLSITLPNKVMSVPGHNCKLVIDPLGGKNFLLGTHEITHQLYYAFITDPTTWEMVEASKEKVTKEEANDEPLMSLRLLPRTGRSFKSVTWQTISDGTASGNEPKDFISVPSEITQLPVTGISLDDANAYCAWLSKRTGLHVRIPTRAEWQLAATGGDPLRIYPWGDTFDKTYTVNALAFPSGKAEAQKPGSRSADVGPFGHYDLAGNVREWLSDRYGDHAGRDDKKVWLGAHMAGGAYFDTNPTTFQSLYTESLSADTPNGQIGFRILVEIP